MNLLGYFKNKNKKTSASVAKERLQILVAHERAARNGPSYLPQLQMELLDVVRKYVKVDQEAITVSVGQEGNQEILELNVTLPESE